MKRKDQLNVWEKDIKRGGGFAERCELINKWTFDRFVEARQDKKPVTTRMLKQWAIAGAMQYESTNFRFSASNRWVTKFKKKYKISSRKVTRYIKSAAAMKLGVISEEVKKFQKRLQTTIPKFESQYVINTDQTGCEYRCEVRRTLSVKGEKQTEVFLGDFNKVTHSYTAQYSITAAGTLLPKVFLCMREQKGNFGPRVYKSIQEMSSNYGNVFVVATTSGKMTKDTFGSYLNNIVMPYVENKKYLLILDSWSGQNDLGYINNVLTDDNGNNLSKIEFIPPHCTSYCQPCDVYFFRQVKNFIKKLQNSTDAIQANRELNTREDAIKIHSLIHHQLSATVFKDMLIYAWYASKLLEKRDVFCNVNEICFPAKLLNMKCVCGRLSFIQCSHCRKCLCFCCFYDVYHPKTCSF